MNTYEIIQLTLDALLIIITGYAFLYAMKEYKLHQKREKAETLARFNERYSNDKNIEAVVLLLMRIEEGITPDKAEQNEDDMKLNYQKEMFLRFFEELQIAIEAGALDKKLVYDIFAFYALKAFEMGEEFYEELTPKQTEETNNGNWYQFRKFITEMYKYENNRDKH